MIFCNYYPQCSLVFAVPHKAGALYAVLRLFAESNVNLTRIASAPRRADPGNYTFFLDFEGSDRDGKIRDLLAEMARCTVDLRFLGCYPSNASF